jgi:hypothetical protein
MSMTLSHRYYCILATLLNHFRQSRAKLIQYSIFHSSSNRRRAAAFSLFQQCVSTHRRQATHIATAKTHFNRVDRFSFTFDSSNPTTCTHSLIHSVHSPTHSFTHSLTLSHSLTLVHTLSHTQSPIHTHARTRVLFLHTPCHDASCPMTLHSSIISVIMCARLYACRMTDATQASRHPHFDCLLHMHNIGE